MTVYEKKYDDTMGLNEMERLTPWWLSLCLFLSGWLGFSLLATVVSLTVSAIGFENLDKANMYVNFFTYLLMALAFLAYMILYKKGSVLKTWLRSFKRRDVWAYGVISLGMIFGISFIINIVITLIFPAIGDNTNEIGVNSMISQFPLQTFFVTVVFAPFCEETTYRYGLFSALKRKNIYLAFIVSTVVFAFIHCDISGLIQALIKGNNEYALNELLNMPMYCGAGFALAYAYYKSGSTAGSFISHALNNLLGFIMQLAV